MDVLGAEANLGASNSTCKNEMVVGDAQFRSSVMSDLTLPKFSDCKRQHIVNFLAELDSYFQMKDVPAEMRLPIAMKSITDEYTQQWVVTIYKELRSYDHLQQAITELLWSPQIQSQVRCSIYQDGLNKSGEEILSAHFLRYAMMAANLTPKMFELEIIFFKHPLLFYRQCYMRWTIHRVRFKTYCYLAFTEKK